MTAPADPRLAAAGDLLNHIACNLATLADAVGDVVASPCDGADLAAQLAVLNAMISTTGSLADDAAAAPGAGRVRDNGWRSPAAAAALAAIEQG